MLLLSHTYTFWKDFSAKVFTVTKSSTEFARNNKISNRKLRFIVKCNSYTSKVGVQLHSNNHRTGFPFHEFWYLSAPIIRISIGVVVLRGGSGSGVRSRAWSRKGICFGSRDSGHIGCHQENSKNNLQKQNDLKM